MSATSYTYNQPTRTFTIDQFIACQSDDDISYNNLSFTDQVKYNFMNEIIEYSAYNVLSDYLEEIRKEYCVQVVLTDEDMYRYKYRPKLLCHTIYGNTELFFIILLINDMCSVKQFNKKTLYLPTKNNMATICKQIYNSNKQIIKIYNNKNTV